MRTHFVYLFVAFGLAYSCFGKNKDNPTELILTAINKAIKAPAKPVAPEIKKDLFVFNTEVAEELAEKLEFDEHEELDQFLDKLLQDNVHRTETGDLLYPVVIRSLARRSPYLEEWKKATNSIHAQLAWAAKQIDIGWKARGHGWATQVEEKDAISFLGCCIEARRICDELEESAPENPSRLELLVDSALALGLREGELEKLVTLSTSSKTPSARLASKLINYLKPRWHGSPSEMADFVANHLPKWPDTPSKFDAIWDVFNEANHWQEKPLLANLRFQSAAERLVGRVDESWPEHSLLVRRITRDSNGQRSYHLTVRLSENALEKFPEHEGLLIDYGRALAETGRNEDGIDSIKKVCEMSPELGNAYYELAKAYQTTKQFRLAFSAAQKALDAENRIHHWQAMECLLLQSRNAFWVFEDYELGLKISAKRLKLDPKNHDAHFALGMNLTKLGRLEEAKKVFQSIRIALDDGNRKWLNENFADWKK